MATVNEKLAAINDEIRTMTNTTAKMGLDTMKTHLAEANAQVSEIGELVAELEAAMEGKSVGGGTSGGAVETCTVTLRSDCTEYCPMNAWYTAFENGAISYKTFTNTGSSTTVKLQNVIPKSFFIVKWFALRSSSVPWDSCVELSGVEHCEDLPYGDFGSYGMLLRITGTGTVDVHATGSPSSGGEPA